MVLPGIDPNDPTPKNRRLLVVAAGVSAGSAPENKVLIFGNKTSAGSETVDVLGTQVLDDTDAQNRMGLRSELFGMWRKFSDVDQGSASVFFIAITESAGSPADVDFTFGGGPATEIGSVEISYMGEDFVQVIEEGDAASNVADNVRTLLGNAAEGQLQLAATGISPVVNVAYIHNGVRGTLALDQMRMTLVEPNGATGITLAKAAVTTGITPDDGAAAFLAAAAGEFVFWIGPWHATASVTNTDGQIGEALSNIKTRYLPAGDKEQTLHIGLVGTQAEATAVATSSIANTELAYFYRAENNDWTPAQLAAHHAAVSRTLVVEHPAMKGAVGYTSTTLTIYNVRDPFDKDDRPTDAEVKADLNNGITPIVFDANGRASISRIITSRSQNSAGDNDYRAREGHITFVTFFYWRQVEIKYSEQLQPFISDNLVEGQKPFPETTTPSDVVGMLQSVVRDMAGRTPIGAQFVGPMLAPDKLQLMLDAAKVLKQVAGFAAFAEIFAVEHLIKSETTVREQSPAY